MRKTTTLLIGLFVAVSSIYAQSIVFLRNGEPLENNAEFTVSEIIVTGLGAREIDSELQIKNLTQSTINATVTQTILEQPTGGTLSFCFGQCVRENEDLSRSEDVEVDVDSELFHMSFILPQIGNATTKVRYEIYPTDNEDDKQTVIVTYDPNSTSLANQNSGNSFSVYQNNNNVVVDYDLNVSGNLQLYVYNATGTVVSQHSLNNNQGSFVLPKSLTRGVYIAVIKKDNSNLSLQKFMIR